MTEPIEDRQLIELYTKMSEGELEKVASESYELTDFARQALRAEIEKRGLAIAVEDVERVEYDEVEFQELVMLRRFRDLSEAMLAKGMLDSAGIESSLKDENMIRMNWFISNLIGGVRLMVKPEDVEAAKEVLNQPIPEGIDYGGEEQFEQPKCPKCGSIDITFEELNKPLSYGSAWVGIPLPISSPKWKCESCGARWVEEQEEAEEEPQP
jgi:hypothetical protein